MDTWRNVSREILHEYIVEAILRKYIVEPIIDDAVRQLMYDVDTYGEDVVCAYLYNYLEKKEQKNG